VAYQSSAACADGPWLPDDCFVRSGAKGKKEPYSALKAWTGSTRAARIA